MVRHVISYGRVCLCAGAGVFLPHWTYRTFVVVMASELCGKCAQLLRAFAANFKKFCTDFEQRIRELIRELGRCTCLKKRATSLNRQRKREKKTTDELTLLHLLDNGMWEGVRFTISVFLFCISSSFNEIRYDYSSHYF